MPSDMGAILERVAATLTRRNAPLTAEEGVEFGRALSGLADRIEQAAGILRQLVEQVNPQALNDDLKLPPPANSR